MSDNELQYLKSFKDVCKKVNASLDSGEVLRAIAENTVRLLHVKGSTILLLDHLSGELHVVASSGLSDLYVHKGPMIAERSIADCMQGRAVLVADATTDPRVQYREEAKREGVISILSMPMTLRDRVIGMLRVYTATPHEFSAIEEEFISGLAEIGSIAIENARMHGQLRASYDSLVVEMHEWFGERGRV